MPLRRFSLVVLVAACVLPLAAEPVENFRLTDHLDRSWELYALEEAPAVVLYQQGNGCPIVRQSMPALARLQEEFGPKGVVFLMLNANTQDTRADIREEAGEFNLPFPVLLDSTQRITLGLGVKRTAEVLVIRPGDQWSVVYRGALDDRFDYGAQRDTATREYVREALTAILAGEPVPTAKTETKGCLINFVQPEQVSYANDVAPILANKCVPCHVQGGLGPFAMNNQRRVRGWAPMIRETIRTKRMPPWHADPEYGTYRHDLALSVEEERTLLAWLDAGAPKEDGADPLRALDKPPKTEWALGEPDMVVSMPRAEELPAEGLIDYRYIYVDPGLKEDKWVRAAQVMPGTPSVVHHALMFIVYPEQFEHIQPNHRGGLSGYFEAFLPGAEIEPYPAGTGQFVPAGSIFVFQMHYTATGKPESDLTRMALYFHDEAPEKELMIRAASTTDFDIPPHAADHPVKVTYEFRRPAEVWGVSPHMHYRGSRARFDALLPEAGRVTLLNVPFYEFDWQPMYMLNEPLRVPEGATIEVTGAWNNSRFNRKNPDPSQTVDFGEQSWEEMFIGYIKMAVERNPERYTPRPVTREMGEPLTKENLVGSSWRFGRNIRVRLEADGVAYLNGFVKGAWQLDGCMLHLRGMGQNVTVLIRNDQILFNGRVLDVEREDVPARDQTASAG
jgi:thiol-disulfide isomerase/thioredoxin